MVVGGSRYDLVFSELLEAAGEHDILHVLFACVARTDNLSMGETEHYESMKRGAKMENTVFLVVSLSILAVLLILGYKTNQKRYSGMFILALFCLSAFYLFQYGELYSFKLKGLETEASFIRQTKQRATEDAVEIQKLLAESKAIKAAMEKTKVEISGLKKRLNDTTVLASPPTLKEASWEGKNTDAGYCIILQFTPSKNEPLGSLVFSARVDDGSDAKILKFWPHLSGGGFATGKDSQKIDPSGKSANLTYSILTAGRPTVELTLSKKDLIKMEGNYLTEPIIVNPP